MKVPPALTGLPVAPAGLCVALGMFDGVHLGHQQVIQRALDDARRHGCASLVLTFDPHPLAVVAPDRAPRLLQTPAQRLRAIRALAPDFVVLLPFTRELSAVSGEDFARGLAAASGPLRSITVGEGFQFGARRSGDVPLLRRLGAELGFGVNALPPVRQGDDIVSSTRIRSQLAAGDLAGVAALLGRPYALAGVVQAGDRLARQLGFPTANLDPAGLALPPAGVYAARAWLAGTARPAVLNLGSRPTVANPGAAPRCEVHVLDFDGDLYGTELEVEFRHFLRPEQRFASVDALRDQVAADIAAARALLAPPG